jgi:hypothetical protein
MEHTEAHESAGTDSFLDVTTNIVGILIILVMVVGVRAQNPIVQATSATESEEKVSALSRQSAEIEYDVRRLSDQTAAVENEIQARSIERQAIATMIAAAENQIADERSRLDSSKQADFDLRRQLEESKSLLAKGEAELESVKDIKAPVEEVRHYPTPISRTVLGHEIHFQLTGGRVAYIPLDDFISDVRDDMRRSGRDLASMDDRVGVVGPRNGFELRYTVDAIMERGRGIVGVRTKEWVIVPVGIEQGEPLATAMARQSEFRSALARHSPRDTTVTLWTYPDSFDEYRRVKEELHNLGYATAGRPLPKGVPIGGSDRGTKSNAQ